MKRWMSCAVWGCCSVVLQRPAYSRQIYPDVPFRQARAVHFKNEVDLERHQLRTVRVDRDGRVLINTDHGLLTACDRRLVHYRGLAALEKLNHLDLGLLDRRFVFLTDNMLLPLDRAGADYLDNVEQGFTRVAARSRGHYLLLAERSIAEWRDGSLNQRSNPGYTEVVRDNHGDGFILYAADRLARYDAGTLRSLPVPPAAIRGVIAVAPDRLKIATAEGLFNVSLQSAETDPTPTPTLDLTCIDHDSQGRIWVGSARGAFCIEPSGRLRYYAGRRWLQDDHVLDLFVDVDDDVYILSRGGLSKLMFERMTLADKAELYLRNLRLHHIRYSLVSDVNLVGGDCAYSQMRDRDNDGLWSSIYLAAEAFRYAVTQDAGALANVTEGFDAVQRLVTITGIPGFQARTFELEGFRITDPERWRTRPQGDFEWKGHTSSDEIVGTMFFYSVFHETVAKGNPDLEKRVANVLASIMDHIVDHDLYLVDVDGRPTTWGRWNPEYVNTDAVGGDRRLNSIEILSFLQFAYAVTGSPKYREVFYDLVNKHGYAENTNHYLPDPMGPWNHSDDELYWLSYYNLVRHCLDERLKPMFVHSAREHAKATARKRNPLWNFIYGSITGEAIDLDRSAFVLREFPLDRRCWRMENSHRLDIRKSVRPLCEPESVELLSPAERCASKWNVNDMALDGGTDGDHAESGAEYLLPYWMGRFYGYISPPR